MKFKEYLKEMGTGIPLEAGPFITKQTLKKFKKKYKGNVEAFFNDLKSRGISVTDLDKRKIMAAFEEL